MRRTTLARGGALLTAATLAISLSAGPATADSTQTESGTIAPDTSFAPDRGAAYPAPAAAKTGAGATGKDASITAAGDATINKFSFNSTVMGSLQKDQNGATIPFQYQTVYSRGTITFNFFNGAALGTPADGGPTAWTQATVNGVFKSNPADQVPLWANRTGEAYPGAEIPRRFGAGRISFGPQAVVYTTHDAAQGPWTLIDAASYSFYVRRDTFGTFKARHSGRTVSFGARARLRATDGSAISAKRGYIQYSSNGSWKTLKTLTLDSTGNAKWSYRTSSKRTYRFLVKRTTVVNGMTIKLPKL